MNTCNNKKEHEKHAKQKKLVTKDHKRYDSICIKYPEWEHSQRWNQISGYF